MSGDLELYVLGMLPEEEAAKISQLAILFEEVDSEINRIRETLHLLADEADMEPGAHVRENFINTLKELNKEEGSIVYDKSETENISSTKAGRVVSMSSGSNTKTYLLAASVILLVVSIASIVYLFNKNNMYQQQIAEVKTTLQNNQFELDRSAQMLAAVQDPATIKIQLKNVPGKPEALAQVFWNKKTHRVIFADVSLPAAPSGKQYQLWALVNGKPVDAGMINDKSGCITKYESI